MVFVEYEAQPPFASPAVKPGVISVNSPVAHTKPGQRGDLSTGTLSTCLLVPGWVPHTTACQTGSRLDSNIHLHLADSGAG